MEGAVRSRKYGIDTKVTQSISEMIKSPKEAMKGCKLDSAIV